MIDFLEYIITEKRKQMITASPRDCRRLEIEIEQTKRVIEELEE